MKLYIAAAIQQYNVAELLAQMLEAKGYQITSRWHRDPRHYGRWQNFNSDILPSPQTRALEDLADIAASDCFICLTGSKFSTARHFETGYAVAMQKSLVIVGEAEHLFHHLPNTVHLQSGDQLLAYFSPRPEWQPAT